MIIMSDWRPGFQPPSSSQPIVVVMIEGKRLPPTTMMKQSPMVRQRACFIGAHPFDEGGRLFL
jgi:hypothetical protein